MENSNHSYQEKDNENKIEKINKIKNYLEDLNLRLNSVLLESQGKMKEVVEKKEAEKINQLLEDLKNM